MMCLFTGTDILELCFHINKSCQLTLPFFERWSPKLL